MISVDVDQHKKLILENKINIEPRSRPVDPDTGPATTTPRSMLDIDLR
jgi:hypothetical protein